MHTPLRIGLSMEVFLLFKQHAEVFAGVQRYADEQGWETIIDDWAEVTLKQARPGRPPYEGLIARVRPGNIELIDAARRAGVPLVNVLRDTPAFDRLAGVFPDFTESGRLAAEHLHARGLRRFGLLAVQDNLPYEIEADGFVSALSELDYTAAVHLTPKNWDHTEEAYQDNIAQLQRFLESWETPIGVAVCNSSIARILIQMCQTYGYRVPGDVAIVSMRNEERLCEQPRPSITAVELGYERVGYEAAKLLGRMMDQTKPGNQPSGSRKRAELPPVERVHLTLPPVGIVVRGSTDFYAVDDALVADAMSYIAEQCHMPLQVVEIAEYVGVSSKTLQNRFREVLGRTVAQEVRRVRIERVKRELADTDRSIDEIAQRAGFASGTRLFEVFRRELGISPSRYRQQRKVHPKHSRG